jgi:hypothetical protein
MLRWERFAGMAQGDVSEQRVDGGEAVVAGGGAVSSFALEVGQERGDQRRVQVVDAELARGPAAAGGGEGQQQPERLPVAGDRVRAGGALADQPFGEVRLQGGGQRGHRASPGVSRSAASSISSGEADRYQYVSEGLTCPR